MSLLSRVLYGPSTGSGGMNWTWPSVSYTGESVSVDNSLSLVPVFNAVSQIAGGVATLPLDVYQRAGRYRNRKESGPIYSLLHDEPNEEMASDEFFEVLESHIDLWGNAFVYKKKDSQGRVYALWIIAPERVGVYRGEDGRREFWVEGERFYEDTILHFRGLSLDGLVGYSPIQLARNTLGIAKAQEKWQAEFLTDEGKPAVILRHPNSLKPEAQARLKESWDAVKRGGTAVLEEDVKVDPWTMPLADAQFIEQNEFSDKRIAQMFLLQPGRLGAKTGDSLTYATTESEARDFVTFTLNRRLKRIESTLNRERGLFPANRSTFCEFDRSALLQANKKERYEALKLGKEAGFLTVEDIRAEENLSKPEPSSNEPETPETAPDGLESPPSPSVSPN